MACEHRMKIHVELARGQITQTQRGRAERAHRAAFAAGAIAASPAQSRAAVLRGPNPTRRWPSAISAVFAAWSRSVLSHAPRSRSAEKTRSCKRIVHHADMRLPLLHVGDGYGEQREMPRIIGGAIQRIDHPQRTSRPAAAPGLLRPEWPRADRATRIRSTIGLLGSQCRRRCRNRASLWREFRAAQESARAAPGRRRGQRAGQIGSRSDMVSVTH